jgi:hypothetical protein
VDTPQRGRNPNLYTLQSQWRRNFGEVPLWKIPRQLNFNEIALIITSIDWADGSLPFILQARTMSVLICAKGRLCNC